jgi:hypothetical protein
VPKDGTRFTLPRAAQMIYYYFVLKTEDDKSGETIFALQPVYLATPGPACVSRRRPQTRAEECSTVVSSFPLQMAKSCISNLRSEQYSAQIKHTIGNVPCIHGTVGQCCVQAVILDVTACYCCFEANNAQNWREDHLNRGQAAFRIHPTRTACKMGEVKLHSVLG